MRPQLDLDGDLAGRRGHALADPDGDAGCDVFSRAQRGAACGTAARPSRVEGAGRRTGRRRTEFEPIEAEAAAQPVEHAWTTAGEGAGRCRELQPFTGAELTDAALVPVIVSLPRHSLSSP